MENPVSASLFKDYLLENQLINEAGDWPISIARSTY